MKVFIVRQEAFELVGEFQDFKQAYHKITDLENANLASITIMQSPKDNKFHIKGFPWTTHDTLREAWETHRLNTDALQGGTVCDTDTRTQITQLIDECDVVCLDCKRLKKSTQELGIKCNNCYSESVQAAIGQRKAG
jgi:hypothetical protein